ncbi:hypothetical protein J5N97_008321 [Dioscorea zingiberensis]|uniref:U-box domain-containing protein n=1 Tax=Dioscorea zingiberensis TaxID=325984 RepID=A0A9D5DGR5_9LILI|nr:hypothetical protein J5N97_008321 [Dioscorea zingiberensis]
MEVPELFRCPISMELMENPVTISTGVTYEKKNIEKWLFTFKKATCPATMQTLTSFHLTPNHTLKSLISSWLKVSSHDQPPSSHPSSLSSNLILPNILSTIHSTPFKVNSLKKLKTLMAASKDDHDHQRLFITSGGIQVLGSIMHQVTISTDDQNTDFAAFRACEEAVGVLSHLHLTEKSPAELLAKPEFMKPLVIMLQRGSTNARLNSMTILLKMSRIINININIENNNDQDHFDVFKSLMDLLSDEISGELGSYSLEVLLSLIASSKKNRVKVIEAGAVCVLIELLSDIANRHKCEKMMLFLKRLCECPEGRLAFSEHGMGIAVVSKKLSRVSETATKLGVKILWLVSSFSPSEKVLNEMLFCGAIRKLVGLLHIDGRSSTKEKALKIIRMHGGFWRQYPCFPSELKDYMRLLHP